MFSCFVVVRMGLYGKYTAAVHVLSITQMVAGVLMLFLGIALRIFVCSWITNAAFGFWVGLWIFIGGLIGQKSAKKNVYGMIGYFLGFNSLSIMLTSVVIFCHSLALVHSHMEMQAVGNNISNHSRNIMPSFAFPNISNSTRTGIISAYPTLSTTHQFTQVRPNASATQHPNQTLAASATTFSDTFNKTSRGCYTHQTWSDYENGKRGLGLGASMIFVCSVEILVAVLSFGYCWSAVNVKPTDVVRHKAVAQGIYSDVVSSENVRAVVTDLHVTGNEEERPPETERTTSNGDEEELDHQYEDIPAASDTKERPVNIYDSYPGASEVELRQDPEQSSDCEKDESQMHVYSSMDCEKDESQMHAYSSMDCEKDESQMHAYSSMDCEKDESQMHAYSSVCDAMEMRPMGCSANAPETSTNDQPPCSFPHSSLPPFDPPPYPSFFTPYPDSE